MKRLVCATLVALAIGGSAHADDPANWIRNTLSQARSSADSCSVEAAAIDGTISRIGSLKLPTEGKVIVVNIPSGVVTAYQDGVPVIESKAVVGKAATPTPEMDTVVTYVRPNPTWTVPKSIIKRNGWLKKLEDNPDFFEESGFDIVAGGQTLSPHEAAQDPQSVEAFIQRPGEGNALGSIKIGIDNAQAIYLHDTNDPGKFGSEVRAASAGCVRLEKVTEIASWILGMEEGELGTLVSDGSTESITPREQVRVILGYWTAWPDSSGEVRVYPDIYNKDKVCGAGEQSDAEAWTEQSDQPSQSTTAEQKPAPRFIPDGGVEEDPQPTWTEYEGR